VKHAKATEVIVQLMESNGVLHITVEDNGKGFDMEKIKKPGIGIKNIRSRTDYLNGKIEIDSKIGVGTSVSIKIHTDQLINNLG
jgi:signal transduction histidine kinase